MTARSGTSSACDQHYPFLLKENLLKAKLKAVVAALMSKEARGPELAIFRIVVAALGLKLGINLFDWAK